MDGCKCWCQPLLPGRHLPIIKVPLCGTRLRAPGPLLIASFLSRDNCPSTERYIHLLQIYSLVSHWFMVIHFLLKYPLFCVQSFIIHWIFCSTCRFNTAIWNPVQTCSVGHSQWNLATVSSMNYLLCHETWTVTRETWLLDYYKVRHDHYQETHYEL